MIYDDEDKFESNAISYEYQTTKIFLYDHSPFESNAISYEYQTILVQI